MLTVSHVSVLLWTLFSFLPCLLFPPFLLISRVTFLPSFSALTCCFFSTHASPDPSLSIVPGALLARRRRRAATHEHTHTNTPAHAHMSAYTQGQGEQEKGRSCSVCWGEHIAWGFNKGRRMKAFTCEILSVHLCIVCEIVSTHLLACACVRVVSCNIATVIFYCETVPKTLTLFLWDCFARFALENPCSSKTVSFIVHFLIKWWQGLFWCIIIRMGWFPGHKTSSSRGCNVTLRVTNDTNFYILPVLILDVFSHP